MTTTTQALSGAEQAEYLKIQKEMEKLGGQELKDFVELQGQIVNGVVSGNSSVRGDIANQVRARILNNKKYNKYI